MSIADRRSPHRIVTVIFACSLPVWLAVSSDAPLAQSTSRDWEECRDVNNIAAADRNIASCTRILSNAKENRYNRAGALINRCGLWNAKRDSNRALSDCNRSLKLDPGNHLAFHNRGTAYSNRSDYDLAIADYNQAIRIDRRYVIAYHGRGRAYEGKGEFDRAISDYNEAIRVNPRYAAAYINRGGMYRAKGELSRALADFDEAIAIDTKHAWSYAHRGRASLHSGSLAKALSDLKQASDLDPANAYFALWLDIILRRNNLSSGLREAAQGLDMTQWPAPVVRLFVGEMTPEQALAAVEERNRPRRNVQLCELNFYSGVLALQQTKTDEAIRLLQRAAADCPRTELERTDARAELRALGLQP